MSDDMKERHTLAPRCDGECGRQLDDPGQEHWLVLTGVYGQPLYFLCGYCETARAEWIDKALKREDFGMVRLETHHPHEVLGMLRGWLPGR